MRIPCSFCLKSLRQLFPSWLVVTFFILISNQLLGQRIEFSRENQDDFLRQLNYLTEGLARTERTEAQQIIDSFSVLWQSARLSDSRKDVVVSTLNRMQTLRLRPWPEQALYFKGVLAVLKTLEANTNFDVWHESIQPLMKIQQQRRLQRYWEATLQLFADNILYASNIVKWTLVNNNYVLSYHDNTPRVIFRQSDLKCYSQGDSTVIVNTRGEVHLLDDKLTGRGGKITWQRARLHPDTVWADLADYTINLTAARWEADSVRFHNLHFFRETLKGKLSERIVAEVNHETATFPRFDSYQSVHEIKNLFPGVDFRGGFTMAGPRVIGSGTLFEEATIKIYRSDSLFITARGRSFSIHSDRIVTQRAAVSIYLSGDSIYHPGINMRYLNPTREFSVLRDERGFSKAPFTNSFHKIDMYCEAIYWNIDTWDIDLRMIRSINETGEAIFESSNYFSDVRYMRMQGFSDLHPLIHIRNYARQYGSETFFVAEYAKFVRGDPTSVSAQLLAFSQDGFLAYNHEDETVTIQPKLHHYIGAYAGRNDFDVIRINSNAAVNAKINMNNFDLQIFGVERIPLSDKKNVVIHPNNQQVIMKKNRDIYFNGRIESGLFDFYGKEFFFNYDNFKIDLLQTDSMSFSVRSHQPDSRGRYENVRVKTVLEGINGELLVDHPRNKSGQLPYPRYPIFNSNNESYVFYEKKEVQKGVYKRDNVFFRLIPFSIDSLDNATTDNIAFDGVFISTGIFPDFYDYLTVQPDYSLGFNTKTPQDGYKIYNGKATYKGPINMSYEGLRADGELQYLNANVKARQMLMFPDSARAMVNTFNLSARKSPVEYPEVTAMNVNMLYLPHNDEMNLKNTDKPFDIYAGVAMLKGNLTLTPDGLSGKGELDFFGGRMYSEAFDFNMIDFDAARSNLAILTADGQNTAITASNYNSNVNFEKRTAELRPMETGAKLDFNFNRYVAEGFEMDWDMAARKVEMSNTLKDKLDALAPMAPEDWITYDFKGYELTSTHPAQDGLKFYAGKIDYRIDRGVIEASDIKVILVADAAVFPDEGKAEILEWAEIKKLEHASVLANVTTRLHRFYEAGIHIISRWNYYGTGMYDFVDETGNAQVLKFSSISVDRAFRSTIARSEVEKEQEFTISPRFGFFGNIDLKAEKPHFTYAGATRMFIDCPNYNLNWFKFDAEINKDSIYIPIANDLRNEANGRIVTSMMLAGDSVHVYPAVFDRQRHYSDLAMLSVTGGYLTWDHQMSQYQLTTAEKHRKASLPDNIITINPSTCVIDGNGDITLNGDMGQFKLSTFGRITHDLKENELNLDVVMGIDFFFLNQALGLVQAALNRSENTEPVNINRIKYSGLLQKRTTETTAQRLLDEYISDGSFRRFPPEMAHTFFFADLKMKWNQPSQTFYSTDRLGIGNMDRFPLNKYVDGFLEIKKQRGGDLFNLVLIPSGLADEGIGVDWFYFTYNNSIMQTIASSNDFNNMIRSVKPNKRRMEVERGQAPFSFILSADRRPFDFVRSMRLMKVNL